MKERRQGRPKTGETESEAWGAAHAGGEACLVHLDQDHPGFRDREYRARRDIIARIALDYRSGAIPEAPYTAEEHAVWREVWARLGPLHDRWAPRGYLILNRRLGMSRDRIPQLEDVNQKLRPITGFEMEPVAGLIAPRVFLSYLADAVFLATQYVRHHSAPLYTPEPDVIHELVGHAASFTNPMIAELNRAFGRAAQEADDTELVALERAYWWTLEFGALVEEGQVKAFGSGLLSSCGEIARFATEAELLSFDIERMAATGYDPTRYQPQVFLAPSWEVLYNDLHSWLHDGGWRRR